MVRPAVSRASVVAAAIAFVLLSLTGCTASGDSVARDQADQTAATIGKDLTPPVIRSRPATTLAGEVLTDPAANSDNDGIRTAVETLAWAGDSGNPSGARIDIRVTVRVDEKDAVDVGQPDRLPGSAVRCWRLTVFGFRSFDTLHRDEIDCPTTPGRVPPNVPIPTLPADTQQRLSAALATATDTDLDQVVHAAFPEAGLTLDTGSRAGELVATVGIPNERRCVLGVRHSDGTVQVGQPSGVQLEPGETGCTVQLYFAPVTTH
jgi:hypothetical protein